MSDINEIFGSGSENESENNEAEHHEEEAQEEEVEHEQEEEEEHEQEAEEEHDQELVEDQEHDGEEDNEHEQEEEQENDEELEHVENDEVEEAEEEEVEDDEDIIKKAPKAAEEVFGDELADLSESENEVEEEQDQEGENEHDTNNQSQILMEHEEEEEQEPEQVIDIEVPRVKTDLGKEVHFVKLPNFLSVEPRPFDTDTYEDDNPKGDALDEEGKSRVRLKVENTIRWRYEKDEKGDLVKRSNAKIVKWSDGSLSMYLGNEIFDVYKAFMQGDHNHLFVRQGNVLHGQTVFKTKLTFRPHSIDSNTHRKMTMSLVQSGSKTKKVKILNEIAKNPENKRQELMKQEEEKLKAASRRQNQQRRMREKSHQKGLSAKYLEDRYNSDDDNGISLSDIKSKFKRGSKNESKASMYSSSEESDRERRLNKAKLNDYEDDYDESEDEDEYDEVPHHKKSSGHSSSKKKKMRKVVSDDEDD